MLLCSQVMALTRFSENFDLWPWDHSKSHEIFSSCTYGINLKILVDFVLELSYLQIFQKTWPWGWCRWDLNLSEIFSTFSDGINWKVRHCLVLELFINCPCCLPAQQGDNTSSAFYSWGVKMRSFGRFFSIQKQEKLWVMLDNRETKAS